MKNNYFRIFATLHIIFIICISSISAYNSYCEYYKIKKDSLIINQLSKILIPKFMQLYGRISGCDAGYGFFAPNVRSSGIVVLENNHVKYCPEFKSLEARIRFSTFESTISDHLLDNTPIKDKTNDSLSTAYYDLLFKAIAVKLLNEKKCESLSPIITYNLYDFPSLEMYRKGERHNSLQKLYQLELGFNNQ